MRIVDAKNWKQERMIEQTISDDLTIRCEVCGHSIIFTDGPKDKKICNHCGHYAYANKESKDKRIDEQKKAQFRMNVRRAGKTFTVRDFESVTLGDMDRYYCNGSLNEIDYKKQIVIIREA